MIQLLIEIDEELYKKTKDGYLSCIDALGICEYVSNGKPLPKGHGRLIDADAVLKEIIYAQKSLESNNDSMWEINKPYFKGLAWAHRIVLDVPTVIEADKEEGAD